MLSRRVTDITGNIYGKLTVIEYAGNNKRGEAEWSCKCECGKQVTVKGTNLRKGVTISCGCARKKIHNTGNLEGKTFGDLTVLNLYETDTKKKKKSWLCKCTCGNTTIVTGSHLRSGYVKSCGCRASINALKQLPGARKKAFRDGTIVSIKNDKARSNTGIKGISKLNTGYYKVALELRKHRRFVNLYASLASAIKARKEAEEQYFAPIIKKWQIEDSSKDLTKKE